MPLPTKILLIDNNPADRTSLARYMRNECSEFRLYEASNGKTGLELFQTVKPDCVVMELKFDDMLGVEMLNLLKGEMNDRTVPIFIWTRLSHFMLKSTASTLGIQGYFEKSGGSESRRVAALVDALPRT